MYVNVTGTSVSHLTLTSSANPVQVNSGQDVLTASISPAVGDGTVTFNFAGPNGATAASQTCTPVNGACHVTWTPQVAGVWAISATWGGDAQYSASTSTIQVTVKLPGSTTQVVANPSSLVPNQQGTLTATVSPAVSDGTITFTVVRAERLERQPQPGEW